MVKPILAYNPEREAFGEEVFGSGAVEIAQEQALVDEMEEMEYASELLEARDERQLERVLGDILGAFSPLAPGSAEAIALRSMLGKVAKRALPMLSSAPLGAPPRSRPSGQRRLSDTAAELFGMHLEGLSDEDQEFEAAKAVVRLAAAAAAQLKARGAGANPLAPAKAALVASARTHAPGLLAPHHAPGAGAMRTPGTGY